MRPLILLGLLASAGLSLGADHRVRVVQQQYPTYYPYAQYVPTYVPHYSAGYDKDGDVATAIREQTEVIKQLLAILAKGGVKPTEPDTSLEGQVLRVFSNNGCVNCHSASVAKEKGSGLTLVTDDGKLNDKINWNKVEKSVFWGPGRPDRKGMPKGGKDLSDDDYQVIKEMQTRELDK